MSALRPAAVAAEAGEEEFLAGGVPVEVDGHSWSKLGLGRTFGGAHLIAVKRGEFWCA